MAQGYRQPKRNKTTMKATQLKLECYSGMWGRRCCAVCCYHSRRSPSISIFRHFIHIWNTYSTQNVFGSIVVIFNICVLIVIACFHVWIVGGGQYRSVTILRKTMMNSFKRMNSVKTMKTTFFPLLDHNRTIRTFCCWMPYSWFFRMLIVEVALHVIFRSYHIVYFTRF